MSYSLGSFGTYHYDDFGNRVFNPHQPAVQKEYKVGDHIEHSDTDILPVGAVLEAYGNQYVRGPVLNRETPVVRYIVSLTGRPSQIYSYVGYTIKYLPEVKRDWKVGDTISHKDAQNLPVNSMLVYNPRDRDVYATLRKRSDINMSHWVVTANKVSDRGGVLRPVRGVEHHWATQYRIVYIPSSEAR